MACSRLLSTVASSVGSGKIDVRDVGHITIKCTGVAGRAFSEFQVVGRNPVIWVVRRTNSLDKKNTFLRNVERGRRFEVAERASWAHEGGKLGFEAPSDWKGKAGRIDIQIDESDGSISIIELKATDWDLIKRYRIRATALRHARQVWRYVNDAVIAKGKEVCPGVVYERQPSDDNVRLEVEEALHERCLQVVWRNKPDDGAV